MLTGEPTVLTAGLLPSRLDIKSHIASDGCCLDAAEAEAEHMNCDCSKYGFFTQVSADSNLSGVSTTYSLEELSDPAFFTHQCSEIDAMASRVVGESRIKEAIREAVEDGQFCVTIADPRSADIPLIAVSKKFETMTGYRRTEVLGKNCRFLNAGCIVDPADLMRLRAACETGAAFTAVLTNRRKSGEFFLNLLDLRGLTVARNPCTGEELWFLVGIQADVTNAGLDDMKEDHITEMHAIANGIREKLADQLSAMAISGALMTNFCVVDPEESQSDAWCLLPSPTWTVDIGSLHNKSTTAKSWHKEASNEDASMTKLIVYTAAVFLSGILVTQAFHRRARW